MGRKKIELIKRIENDQARNVTLTRRRRGLIKKAMELSKLCDQHVYVVIFDKAK